MTKKVLILGGYGNFGKRISAALVASGVSVIIAGRHQGKAEMLAAELGDLASIAVFDVHHDLTAQLTLLKPMVVVNTCGPFQTVDYTVADTCIEAGVHYIDLADARNFVCDITSLQDKAKKAGVLVVSGASTVPGLSSAVLEAYKNSFSKIESLRYGISPGQKAERGLATTQGILTYVGKVLKPCGGKARYGWQDIYRQSYPELGKRWMANCDVPDLDLFAKKYGIQSIQFSAGMENSVLHLGIWFLSWLIRMGMPLNLAKYASFLLCMSHMFDHLGTNDGGMHMIIKGKDNAGKPKEVRWFIIAKDGDGPHIPTIPAIILVKQLVRGSLTKSGAYPCVGMVTLDEYIRELKDFNVTVHTV